MLSLLTLKQKRMNFQLKFLWLCLASLMLFSCGKDGDSQLEPVDNIPSPVEKISATIYGLILDEAGNPISDVLINIDDETATTDVNGYFKVTGFMNKLGAHLAAKKDGYYDGHGLVVPYVDTEVQVQVVLISKADPDMGESNTPIEFITENALVKFQTDGFVTNTTAYTGGVDIYGKYLDPTDDNFSYIFPGDLQNEENQERKVIQPYALINIELFGDSGQNLDINKSAEIKVDIAQSLLNSAPEEIDLWYLNTETGIWELDGSASKEGDAYVATVEHFTTWCFGVPYVTHRLSGTVSRGGAPYANARIGIGRDNWSIRFFAAADGSYGLNLIEGREYNLYTYDNCGEEIQSDLITGLTEDTTYDVNVTATANSFSVDGNIFCGDNSINTEGAYVVVDFDNSNFRQVVNADVNGDFEFLYEDCNNNSLSVFAYDPINLLISDKLPITGNSNNLSIDLCADTFQGSVTLEFDGYPTRVIDGCLVRVESDNTWPTWINYIFDFTDVFADDTNVTGEFADYFLKVHTGTMGPGGPSVPLGPPSAVLSQSANIPFYYTIYPVSATVVFEDAEKVIITLEGNWVAELEENGQATQQLTGKITLEGYK